MMSKFLFILLISYAVANSVSVGSCVTYSSDGQSCTECIPNYHLFDGNCYVDILGCTDYQFGNICHQCADEYILVNNLCCDMICMSKIFSKFKASTKIEIISNNTDILSQLIPYVQQNYINGTTGRLVSIELKDFTTVRRFFLLYEFYNTGFYSKRLVVDYVFASKKFIIVDWAIAREQWKFSTIQWLEVVDDAAVLKFYPTLYPSGASYLEIVSRKAVVNQVEQY